MADKYYICAEFDCGPDYCKKVTGKDCNEDYTKEPCIFLGEHNILNKNKEV